MAISLSGKVVIITGASSGIGAAAARELVRLGCRVALVARSAEKLRVLAEELEQAALALPADITSALEVGRMVEDTLKRFGRIDVLFANAGVYVPGQFTEGNQDALAHMMDVNVNGVLRCMHVVLPLMIAQRSGAVSYTHLTLPTILLV